MNLSQLLVVLFSIVVAQPSFAAEPSGESERRRPRKEINRVEPLGKTEMRPEKATQAELCNEAGDVKYSARWQKGVVTLTASGSHPSAGYRVFFEQSMLMIYPPEFSLKHERPTGMAAQVISPFSVQTSFKAQEKPQVITVHDAK